MKANFKSYCNRKSLLFYKKNRLYKLINKTIGKCGIIDLDEPQYEFLGTHTPVSYYKGLISDFDPTKFDFSNIKNMYLIIISKLDTSFTLVYDLIKLLKLKEDVNLEISFKFFKYIFKNKIVLLNFE